MQNQGGVLRDATNNHSTPSSNNHHDIHKLEDLEVHAMSAPLRDTTQTQHIITERYQDENSETPKLRKYLLQHFLGKGGFARVYQVTELDTNRKYACKVVEKEKIRRLRARQKLLTEIRIHRSLHHKHIVQFERFFEDEQNVYILLELCENQTIAELIRRAKKLSEDQARRYMYQTMKALKYMHSDKLVIHRDVKLGNLFLSKNDEIRLGDFGLATQLIHEKERKMTICGTPNYIAPEVLSGGFGENQGHSFEADIWSLGVVLFTMLVGHPPFETKNVKSTYERIKQNLYEIPSDLGISAQAKDLITLILSSKPIERPTIDELFQHPFFTSYASSVGGTISDKDKSRDSSFLNSTSSSSLANSSSSLLSTSSSSRNGSDVDILPPLDDESGKEVDMKTSQFGSNLNQQEREALQKANSELETSFAHLEKENLVPAEDVLTNMRQAQRPSQSRNQMASTYTLTGSSAILAASKVGPVSHYMLLPSLPSTAAGVWVSKWVDYSSKYGLGYQLCNEMTGVYFNDGSKAIRLADGSIEYHERADRHQEKPSVYPEKPYPSQLSKKFTLLGHFEDYLSGHTPPGQEEPLASAMTKSEERLETLDTDKRLVVALPSEQRGQGRSTEHAHCSSHAVYVKRWLKTKHAIVFRLSNRTLQVNFVDGSEILLATEPQVISYRNKSRKRAAYKMSQIPNNPDFIKRLRYAKNLLAELIAQNSMI